MFSRLNVLLMSAVRSKLARVGHLSISQRETNHGHIPSWKKAKIVMYGLDILYVFRRGHIAIQQTVIPIPRGPQLVWDGLL